MPQPIQRSGVSILVRSALWILVSVAFLLNKTFQIQHDRQRGLPVTNWDVGIVALWSLVLIFWIYAAFRDWKRRSDARKVV